jgi:hypothetical protein
MTLFERGTLNAFEAVISYSYLCMKMLAINGVIKVHGYQTEARNFEKEHTLGQKNVHAIIEEEKEETENAKPQTKAQACEETKRVPLDLLVPNEQVIIGTGLSQEEEDKLVEFLRRNKDIFTWSSNDLGGVSRDIIEHKLDIDPKVKPKKAKVKKTSRRQSSGC